MVAKYTNGKIKELFSTVSPNIACILVSCTYFKGGWLNKFNPRSTSNAPFHCTEKKTFTVKILTREEYYSYLSVYDKVFNNVKIPYKQTDFIILIILPDEHFD